MTVFVEVQDRLAHVAIDGTSTNADLRTLTDAVAELLGRSDITAVVLTGVQAASVSEDAGQCLLAAVNAIEQSPKPWIAVIDGPCGSSGLALSMGCRWRVATPGATFSLQDVAQGIIPGAGNTVRLPRLVGTASAIELITSGRKITAQRAQEIGLVDELVIDAVSAEAWLNAKLAENWPQSLCDRPLRAEGDAFWRAATLAIAKTAKGNPAPAEALASIRRATEQGFQEALAAEHAAGLRLASTAPARAMHYLHKAEQSAARPHERAAVAVPGIAAAGVVGGGTMGAGIAVAFLNVGIAVWLIERDAAAAERASVNVRAILDADLARGRITRDQINARFLLFRVSTNYDALGHCDLVVEAVFEDLEAKLEVFAALGVACRSDAILATNTSYLDPRTIFSGITNPARLIGLHFFSPANVMRLLEIVPMPNTSVQTVATAFAVAGQLGKVPVQAGICEGFIGNRMLKRFREQAERLVLCGADPHRIDRVLRDFGMAMGVFQVQDLAGLDIGAWQRQAARARGETPFAPMADRLAGLGRLGRKASAGWYDYADGLAAQGLPAPVARAIDQSRREAGSTPIPFADAEIVDALILTLVSEAALIMAQGIALRWSDIDLVQVYGYGFPRSKGGPVQYAREIGLENVVLRLENLAERGFGDGPGSALRRWAEDASSSKSCGVPALIPELCREMGDGV